MHGFGPLLWVFIAAQIPFRALRLRQLSAEGNVTPSRVS